MNQILQYLIPSTISNKKLLKNAVKVDFVNYPLAAYIVVSYKIDKNLLFIRKNIMAEKNLFNFKLDRSLYSVKFKIPDNLRFKYVLAANFGEEAFSKQGAINAMRYWQ